LITTLCSSRGLASGTWACGPPREEDGEAAGRNREFVIASGWRRIRGPWRRRTASRPGAARPARRRSSPRRTGGTGCRCSPMGLEPRLTGRLGWRRHRQGEDGVPLDLVLPIGSVDRSALSRNANPASSPSIPWMFRQPSNRPQIMREPHRPHVARVAHALSPLMPSALFRKTPSPRFGIPRPRRSAARSSRSGGGHTLTRTPASCPATEPAAGAPRRFGLAGGQAE